MDTFYINEHGEMVDQIGGIKPGENACICFGLSPVAFARNDEVLARWRITQLPNLPTSQLLIFPFWRVSLYNVGTRRAFAGENFKKDCDKINAGKRPAIHAAEFAEKYLEVSRIFKCEPLAEKPVIEPVEMFSFVSKLKDNELLSFCERFSGNEKNYLARLRNDMKFLRENSIIQ